MGLNWIHNLSSALGGSADQRPLTLSAVLEELRSEPLSLRLRPRLERLSQKMSVASEEVWSDLDSARWSPQFAACLQQQIEVFDELASYLQRLSDAAAISASDIDQLARLGQHLANLAQRLDDDFRSQSSRCTGCGSQCGDFCDECGLTPLIWDALPEEFSDFPAQGGANFQALYWQVVGLLEGRSGLDDLQQALDDLCLEIEPIRAVDLPALSTLDQALDTLYLGLESRRTSHFLGGWRRLCEGMLQLREQIQSEERLALAS